MATLIRFMPNPTPTAEQVAATNALLEQMSAAGKTDLTRYKGEKW